MNATNKYTKSYNGVLAHDLLLLLSEALDHPQGDHLQSDQYRQFNQINIIKNKYSPIMITNEYPTGLLNMGGDSSGRYNSIIATHYIIPC